MDDGRFLVRYGDYFSYAWLQHGTSIAVPQIEALVSGDLHETGCPWCAELRAILQTANAKHGGIPDARAD